MNSISVTHQGYEIVYDEEQNEWRCRDLHLVSKSLHGLRLKINDVTRAARKLKKPVKAYVVDGWGAGEITITGFATSENQVRAMCDNKVVQFYMSNCVLLTPRTQTRINVWKGVEAEVERMQQRADRMKERLPRITREQLVKLKVNAAPDRE